MDAYTQSKITILKLQNMKEVKIQIPDNCELVKNGDSYVVREKKQNPPRSWEEFCERYPITEKEVYINSHSVILPAGTFAHTNRDITVGKNWCVSKDEAEAFLALMQLRQLRKAWVGDWEQTDSNTYIAAIVYNVNIRKVVVKTGNYWSNITLSFPTPEMAEDFLGCFRDLCETAKNLL